MCGVRKVLQKIKSDGFKVTVEGGGGDEILGGYQYNHLNYILDQVKKEYNELNDYLENLIKNKDSQKILNFLMTLSFQSGLQKTACHL